VPAPATGDAKMPEETLGTAPAPATGDAPPTAPDAGTPQPPAVPDAPPEKIESIAEGVEAKGLRDVLKSAEDLMREQKFAAALEKYEVARQVAPNNSLITMGRANAELAASYYRRAEASLREAVGRAPELVVAQFDLRALVGPERLQVLVSDLKEIAENDKQVARPAILLAYIAYNTGNEAQAGEYLTAAEQRAGGDDALLSAWRKNWTLPKAETPAEDLNK
jgi:tetratricopeptide (TPR) repeat protein